MSEKWRTPLLIGFVLLSAHGASAWYYAARYERHEVAAGAIVLTLDMTPDEWFHATAGTDSSTYLRVAENFAVGRGVTMRATGPGVPHDEPFYFWGPGAPVVLGAWRMLVGGQTMWTYFWFAVVAQILFGMITIATVMLWTKNMLALAMVALFTCFCPPLQYWFYNTNLTSSEIVALVHLSAIVFVLAKGFAAYHATTGMFWEMAIRWRVGLWFALAGLLIGMNSLVRDSGEVLGRFIVVFLIARSLVIDRGRFVLAVCASAALLAGVTIARHPVQRWNKTRIGNRIVSSSNDGLIWRHDLWQTHVGWYTNIGVGFGEYLDPAAAARVEEYFRDHKPYPELYSLGQLAQAVWRRPGDAIAFKVVRWPVLWLGATRMWPTVQVGLVSVWCITFYGSFVALLAIRYRRDQRVPEVLYLYFALMVCASMVVHGEFRYTFPIWNTLVMVPGLLVATLLRSDNGSQSRVQRPGNASRSTDLGPGGMAIAA